MAKKESVSAAPNQPFKVVWKKVNQVEIRGVDFSLAKRNQWQRRIDRFAKELQAEIADEFSQERVAGRHLKRNDPKYTARKIKEGYDPRKGHRTNALQRALGGNRLYTLTFTKGRAFVTFIESRLYRRVDYATYYAEKKVQGRKILQISKKMVRRSAVKLEEWARKLQAKGQKKKAGTAVATSSMAQQFEKARKELGIKLQGRNPLRFPVPGPAQRFTMAARALGLGPPRAITSRFARSSSVLRQVRGR